MVTLYKKAFASDLAKATMPDNKAILKKKQIGFDGYDLGWGDHGF